AYQQGWAGLSFRRGALAQDVTGVRFTVDRAMSLSVIIGNGAQQTTVPIQTTPGVNEYLVTLPAGMTTADRVTIQNATPNPQAPFVLSQIVLDAGKPGTTEPLILTQRDAVEASLQAAADWGRVRGIPVHLGEFGAYHPADTDSRARWTRAVRASAERHGIAWAYWELTAGFGYFDPETDAFREPLLETLTD
ncbi:MAG: cellulase family glycosylhydrolase, partial [Planctomycetota bacterium]